MLLLTLLLLMTGAPQTAPLPVPAEGDYVIRNCRFNSGETLPEVSSADDLVNPPELGILEREIERVPRGRAIVIPLSDQTVGHGTHTRAVVWKAYLEQLLKESER